jgi:hypothetical protein
MNKGPAGVSLGKLKMPLNAVFAKNLLQVVTRISRLWGVFFPMNKRILLFWDV